MISRFRPFRSVVIFVVLGLATQWSWGQSRVSSPNDRARYLAALPLQETSPLKKFEQLPAYQEHAELLDAEWQAKQKTRWDVMTSWAGTEIRPFIDNGAPVFYMFGGPDFLNAYLIYPGAPKYVLCGLETIGRVPPLENLPEERIAADLNNLGMSLKPALDMGFFITKEMGSKLLKGDAYGVLPLLYVLVVRSGNEITGVQYVKLSESGDVILLPGEDPIKAGARGVRITFVRQAGAPTQELDYFRTDLSDQALERDKRFLNYLGTLGRANSYLKAASYLMHSKSFALIRDFLLSQSSSVLQDDSGIPYRAFSPERWRIMLYGNYYGPISEVPWAEQRDLRKAYQAPGAARPLPFKSGYGTKEHANLLFATGAASKAPDAKPKPIQKRTHGDP